MSGWRAWREPSNAIAAVAAMLALVSLVVSVRGCVVADKSFEIANSEFESQRTLILTGTVSGDGDQIDIKTADANLLLQRANVTFPSEIDPQDWPVLSPENELHVLVHRNAIQRLLSERIPRAKGYAIGSLDFRIPLAISATYIAKGKLFRDQSLYQLTYSFVITDDDNHEPRVNFRSLLYVERISHTTDLRAFIDSIWSDMRASQREAFKDLPTK